MEPSRFLRSEELIGKAGQARIRATRCALVGVGGVGSHAAQQLAYLGVGALDLVDGGGLKESNRNRYVTAWHGDATPGLRKVDLARRLVQLIDPSIMVRTIHDALESQPGFAAVRDSDVVFGCVDEDGPR